MLRRARGLILRLVRRRALAIAIGIALVAPAAWLEWGRRSDAWWMGGLSLILGASGAALIWTGVAGNVPDWIERETKK